MSLPTLYADLATLFAYPEKRDAVAAATSRLEQALAVRGVTVDLAPFCTFVTTSDLGQLQEEYVRTFDFNPRCAPYLGHHLFGDTIRKGSFMIALKAFYAECGYIPAGNELPDHLQLLLDCAAHLAEDEPSRKILLRSFVADGLERMNREAAQCPDLPWRHPIAVAAAICAADGEETDHAR